MAGSKESSFNFLGAEYDPKKIRKWGFWTAVAGVFVTFVPGLSGAGLFLIAGGGGAALYADSKVRK